MRYKFLRFPEGRLKAVTLSYDDGCRADIRLSDIVSKYGLKCTFNLTADEKITRLTKEEVEQYILGRGHEIAVHGAHHRAEGMQRPIDGIRDVLDCRLALEKEYGLIVRGMAYPDSGIRMFYNTANYENIKRYLTDLDIVYARSLATDKECVGPMELPADWHAWIPTSHHANSKLPALMDQFLSIKEAPLYSAGLFPRIMYIWGHAYEFDTGNNWELLESICERLSGQDDVWYATNMEIYEYVKAYDSLVSNADETKIYNPTLTTVWFNVDGKEGKTYRVDPGETVRIGGREE